MTQQTDAELIAADAEARRLAVEIEALEALWPSARPAARRAEMVAAMGTAFRQLEGCYRTVLDTEARTPAGAVVKLRRALVLSRTLREMPGEDSAPALAKLIEGALAVVDAQASAPPVAGGGAERRRP